MFKGRVEIKHLESAKSIVSVWSETDHFYSQFYRDEKYLFNHNNFLRFFPISRDRL